MSRPRRLAGRRRAVGLLVAGLGLAALALATERPGDAALYPPAPNAPATSVYVSTNGFHSDLAVPTALLAAGEGPGARAVAMIRPQPWTDLGWGDAVFYQGQGFGVRRALDLAHSVFWPVNASVVHLGSDPDPTRAVPGWRVLRLRLSPEGVAWLKRRLDASFALDPGGRPIAAAAAPGPDAAPDAMFFKSRENAWAFHVCNHWTAELLNAAGVPITPALDLSSAGLAADLRWRGRAEAVSGR